MRIGLVGLQQSGKTTVFNALTGLAADTTGGGKTKTNLGTVKVPDNRIDALAEIYNPKRRVYAEIVFSDIATSMGSMNERGIDRGVLATMREVDALCQVVRAFGDPSLGKPQAPMSEISDLETEMILADLELIEKRLERLKKEKGKPREQDLLTTMKDHLDQARPLRSLNLSSDDFAMFSGYRFLTQKPLLFVLNVDEEKVNEPPDSAVAGYAKEHDLGLVVLSAKVEQDIAQMEPSDQKEFLDSLGLNERASDRFIQAAFTLLDLISFLTAGEDECRAWPIRRGTPAVRAAGKIHSDIERGFIRAEVTHFEDLIALRSEAKCREAGKLRLEGKEYVVEDGDIINFRFNV